MLYEGRMEDEITFMYLFFFWDNFKKFFYVFGEHILGIHEDLIFQSVKQKKIMV